MAKMDSSMLYLKTIKKLQRCSPLSLFCLFNFALINSFADARSAFAQYMVQGLSSACHESVLVFADNMSNTYGARVATLALSGAKHDFYLKSPANPYPNLRRLDVGIDLADSAYNNQSAIDAGNKLLDQPQIILDATRKIFPACINDISVVSVGPSGSEALYVYFLMPSGNLLRGIEIPCESPIANPPWGYFDILCPAKR